MKRYICSFASFLYSIQANCSSITSFPPSRRVAMKNQSLKNKLPHILILVILILQIVSFPSVPVSAEMLQASNPKPCKGLDIVFLVSYAAPMNFNDGIGLRKRAIRTALDILGDNAIYLCPGFQHRIAVIGFGDEEDSSALDWREFVSPTPINSNLSELGEWTEQKYELLLSIPVSEDLGRYTNFREGLKKSADILTNWRKEDFDPATREQAVLIISDGNMCTYEHKCDFENIASSKVFEEILPLVDPSSQYLPASVSISHIGLYTEDMFPFWERHQIVSFWSNIVKQHSGGLYVLQHGVSASDKELANQDIDSKISAVLNDLLGSDLGSAQCDNTGQGIEPIWVEPYKNNFLVLYIYRFGAFEGNKLSEVDVTIEVTKDDGTVEVIKNGLNLDGENSLNEQRFEHTIDGPNERYVFYQPPVGKYTFKIEKANPCKDVSILSGTRGLVSQIISPDPNAKFTEFDVEPFYDVNNPHRFSFQLLQMGRNGQLSPLGELENYPLNPIAYLQTQSNANVFVEDQYELILRDPNNAIYEAVEPINLRYPGQYIWKFAVTTNTSPAQEEQKPSESQFEVLIVEGELEIIPLKRNFDFEIITEIDDEIFLTDKTSNLPLTVQIQVYDDIGNQLREELRISDPSQAPFIAKLFSGQNGKWVEVDSQPMIWGASNIYSVDLKPEQFHSGKYEVHIELTKEYNSSIFIASNSNARVKGFQVSVVKERLFTWSIQSPQDGETNATRPILNWFASPNPASFEISVQADNSIPIEPASMLKSSGKTLFSGTLVDARTQRLYDISFRPGNQSGVFVAEWPEGIAPMGNYILKDVKILLENIQPMWIPNVSVQQGEIRFSLKEYPWTMPWSGLAAIIGGIILIVASFALYLANGSLHNCELLFISDARAKHPCNGSTRIWSLLRTRHYVVKQARIENDLPGCELESIDVSAGKLSSEQRTDGASVVVDLILQWQDGETQSIPGVHDAEPKPLPVSTGISLQLVKTKTNFIRRSWKLLLTTLAVASAWFVLFAYLYINSIPK
jgi:hypothetical protein